MSEGVGGKDGVMRWEELFDDLEAQLAAADAAGLDAEVAERSRHTQGEVTLAQRLRASTGSLVTVGVAGGTTGGAGVGEHHTPIAGTLAGVGPDWLLVSAGGGESLLPLAAVRWVGGLGRAADVGQPGRVWSRLDLRSAVRGLARDRATVTLLARDSGAMTGTVDRVGADHLDLALHPLDEPRRTGSVLGVRTVPLGALLALRRGR